MDFRRGFMTLVLAVSTAIAGVSMVRAGTVQGSVTYLQRIAVPVGAKLLVELRDVSRMDVASTLMAQQQYDLTAVPADYVLRFDDADIIARNSYSISARITLAGQLLFVTDTAYPVLTRGGGEVADLVVKSVPVTPAGPGDLRLDNTSWSLVELNGATVDKGRDPGLIFTLNGQFSASAGCNRFMGQLDLHGDEIRFPEKMAGTLMACVPGQDIQENDFLAALGETSKLMRQGPLLQLLAADGRVLMRLTLAN